MVGTRRLVGLVVTLLAVAATFAPAAIAARPNVVVIVTDDQTLEQFKPEVMPKTVAKLAERGTTFREGIVATPQCCPSRAGLITGEYPQNNKVTANRPGYKLLARKRDVLPNWLRKAGYRTIHIGKYLNGHPKARGTRPGFGWDRWLSLLIADYVSPAWSIDGRYRADHHRYLTTSINSMAQRMVRRYAPRHRPFYLQVDHLAPHVGSGEEHSRCRDAAIPNHRDAHLFEDAKAPRDPATEESDVSDKPAFIDAAGPIGPGLTAEADRFYGCALAALKSVDRGVGALMAALRRAGELRRTMIVFTSDNGFSYLEHQMPLTKGLPYEEHLRVPFVIRPPRRGFPGRFRSGATSDAPVANIDLAPTILKLAHAEPCRAGRRTCRRMDGRSLLPLLRGHDRKWTETRAIRTAFSVNFPVYKRSCRWDGYRTPTEVLAEHVLLPEGDAERCQPASVYEHYDLVDDPFELDGDVPVPTAAIARLDALRHCSGIKGRDPFLRGRPFCE